MIGLYLDTAVEKVTARTYLVQGKRYFEVRDTGSTLRMLNMTREQFTALRDSIQRTLDEAAAEDGLAAAGMTVEEQFADLVEVPEMEVV